MTSACRHARLVSFRVAQWLLLFLVACSFLGTQGCSVYLALNQPSSKDLSVLNAETPRDAVIAELGRPIWMETRGSETVNVHKFVQGYSGWMKGTRAILHAMADVPSLGLWEIPGTLIEKFGLVGVPLTVKITYDADGKVRSCRALRRTSDPCLVTCRPIWFARNSPGTSLTTRLSNSKQRQTCRCGTRRSDGSSCGWNSGGHRCDMGSFVNRTSCVGRCIRGQDGSGHTVELTARTSGSGICMT